MAVGCTPKSTSSEAAKNSISDSDAEAISTALERMVEERNKDSKVIRGKPSPDFDYRTMDGKRVRLADFLGKALLVDIFSPT